MYNRLPFPQLSPDVFRYQLLSNTVASFRDVGKDFIKFDSISQQPFFVWVHIQPPLPINKSDFEGGPVCSQKLALCWHDNHCRFILNNPKWFQIETFNQSWCWKDKFSGMMGAVSWSDSTGPTLPVIPTWMLPSTRWSKCTVYPSRVTK